MAARAAELAGLGIGPEQILSINIVGPKTIAGINRNFVDHEGLTDVISFDYRDGDCGGGDETAVEIFICPDVAEKAAENLPGTSYSREMALYIVHGILHAAGENDLTPTARKSMRAAEARIMKALGKEFSFPEIFPARQ